MQIDPALKEVLEPELKILDKSLENLAGETDGFLGDLLSYVLKGSGKRIRPALVFLAARLGQSDIGKVRTVALAVELIHIATLIHDDVIDRAALRRGSKTVVELEGVDTAILLGDYIYTYAYEKAASLNESGILGLLARSTSTICEGEISQLKRRFQFDLTEEEYFSFIRKKTASLFGVSARCGGILAGVPPTVLEALESFGTKLGVAFQVRDDLLDLIAKEQDMGKTLRTDVLNGKMTLPLIYFREDQKNKSNLDFFLSLLKNPNGHIETLVKKIKDSGSFSRSQQFVEDQVRASFQDIKSLPNGPVRVHLQQLAEILLDRKI